jgi:hypothetical protein
MNFCYRSENIVPSFRKTVSGNFRPIAGEVTANSTPQAVFGSGVGSNGHSERNACVKSTEAGTPGGNQ